MLPKDAENLLSVPTERVSAIVEPLMEAVTATHDRVARLEGGQDELLVKVIELTENVDFGARATPMFFSIEPKLGRNRTGPGQTKCWRSRGQHCGEFGPCRPNFVPNSVDCVAKLTNFRQIIDQVWTDIGPLDHSTACIDRPPGRL